MQKIINDPSLVVDQMLEGFVKANSDLVSTTENERVLKYKNAPVKGKVGVVTGGGSGHKPAFVGYIGRNMSAIPKEEKRDGHRGRNLLFMPKRKRKGRV